MSLQEEGWDVDWIDLAQEGSRWWLLWMR